MYLKIRFKPKNVKYKAKFKTKTYQYNLPFFRYCGICTFYSIPIAHVLEQSFLKD